MVHSLFECIAAWTLVKIGDTSYISVLAELLTDKDPAVVAIGQETLTAFSGNITQPVVRTFAISTDAGKIAALELLAVRKADTAVNTVLEKSKAVLRK